MERTDNLNIVRFKPLITPEELKKEFPETDEKLLLAIGTKIFPEHLFFSNIYCMGNEL